MGRVASVPWFIAVGAMVTALFCVASCQRDPTGQAEKRVVILGMDGLDPQIVTALMSQGKLQNFMRLKERGDFRTLATSVPPLSPVAWSNFITGLNPGGHGIFDFIHREPGTLVPYLSTSRAQGPSKTVQLGDWVFPLEGGKVDLLRKGRAFWEILEEHGIPTTVSRIPANFPPVNAAGRSLAGMGTPDILGTYGTYSLFTDQPSDHADQVSGGQIIPVVVINHRVEARLYGPANTFRTRQDRATAEFAVWFDPEHHLAKLAIQEQEILLEQGEWSEWVRVEFSLVPGLSSVSGICRFYLKEVHPRFALYVTPINLDPESPALPISTPPTYARDLARSIGLFYTQGMPEDTKAFNARVLDEAEFKTQAWMVLKEQTAMLDYELDRFRSGVLFFYLSTPDPVAHMFWASMDPKHPGHDPKIGARFGGAIEAAYQEMDRLLGTVLDRIGGQTTLIVMSDHGFAPFYRHFNLNTWLVNNGYLALKDETAPGVRTLFKSVDWRRTRAYGLGLNGLYLNLRGRENQGIVDREEKAALADEIAARLLQVRDPVSGQPVIARVYHASDVYSGPYVETAPDMVVGYNRGYRSSNKTALGEIPAEVLGDNREKWSGDHAMAADLVPGVVFANRKIKINTPALSDLTVTVLAEFGIQPEGAMKGKPIF
jgi:predicted AlkP superfamily phosphohydrolase/phosphomutase